MRGENIKYLKILCAVLFIARVFPNASCETVPRWLTHTNSEFPDTLYVRAVGTGTNEKAARNDALSSISFYFDTKTDVVTSCIKELGEIEKDGVVKSMDTEIYRQSVNVSSAADFFCVTFTETYYDKAGDKFSCLAYINKSEAVSIYASRVSYFLDSISVYKKIAAAEKELFYKAGILHKEAVLAKLCEQYIRNIITLSPKDAEKYKDSLTELSFIQEEQSQLKKDMTFEILMTQDEKKYDAIFTTVAKVLEEQGFVYSVKESSYRIIVSLSFTEEEYSAGPFVRPSIEIITVNDEGKSVYSYSKAYPRTGAKTMDAAYTRALFKIQKDIEANLFLEYR